jgi:hypothetical protein
LFPDPWPGLGGASRFRSSPFTSTQRRGTSHFNRGVPGERTFPKEKEKEKKGKEKTFHYSTFSGVRFLVVAHYVK